MYAVLAAASLVRGELAHSARFLLCAASLPRRVVHGKSGDTSQHVRCRVLGHHGVPEQSAVTEVCRGC